MLGICAAAIAAIIFLPRLLPSLGGNVIWLFLLACPLMHLFMMKGHGHNGKADQPDNHSSQAGHNMSGDDKKEK